MENGAFKIEHEGYKAEVYKTHSLFLYIEDEWMGELKLNYNNSFIPLASVVGIFKNEKEFWDKLTERYFIYEGLYACSSSWLFDTLEKQYGIFVARKLDKIFAQIMTERDTEYEDNWRFCRIGNSEEEKEYNRIQGMGCCGFVDVIVEVDGVKWKIGFNYGH
jgi:hypothetical protein